jgi:hypothetical protein
LYINVVNNADLLVRTLVRTLDKHVDRSFLISHPGIYTAPEIAYSLLALGNRGGGGKAVDFFETGSLVSKSDVVRSMAGG